MKSPILFLILCFLFSFEDVLGKSISNKESLYKKVFSNYTQIKKFKVKDTISDNPINTEIIGLYKGKELLGFAREISTTTGCNSACLPVVYTSFYGPKGDFKKVLSRDGLTKIYHAPFDDKDYNKLNILVSFPSTEVISVSHPKELTDAISGETFKKYESGVVKGAAYTTLRVIHYNIQTIKDIQKILKK